jgi:hypothetical protein
MQIAAPEHLLIQRAISNVALCLPLLGLALAGCERGDGPPPASAPAPAATSPAAVPEQSFEVYSVTRGIDGQRQVDKVRMTDSQWKVIAERRRLGCMDPSKAVSNARSPIFESQQSLTVTASCSECYTSWIFSGSSQTGNRTCLAGWWSDSNDPSNVYNVGYAIHSYDAGNSGLTVICKDTADCNVWTCGNGRSVQVNGGQCPYCGGCTGYVATAPPPYTVQYVHMQISPFNCH